MSSISTQSSILPILHKEKPTIIDILLWRAANQPDRQGYIFLKDGESNEQILTYSQLLSQVQSVAHRLQKEGLTGERAVLLLPSCLEYITAFLGCLYAGVIAVPTFPPDPTRLKVTLPKLQGIINDSEAKVILTNKRILTFSPLFLNQAPDLKKLKWIETESVAKGKKIICDPYDISSDDIALLQYTSGSTSSPKGVMLTHANLMHNEMMLNEITGFDENTLSACWVPLYHNMGLIGNLLQPLYAGFPTIFTSPLTFLQKPLSWLRIMSKYKATTTVGPNSAYELCAKKATEKDKEGLDLSSWSVAICGSEPVRKSMIDSFAEAFEPCGFRREAFHPGYGLSESTLMVVISRGGKDAAYTNLSQKSLQNGLVEELGDNELNNEENLELVSCGKAIAGMDVCIVNPDTLEVCPENQIGEIWVSGPSVGKGYWQNPEQTKETFGFHLPGSDKTYLRTGDLGFLKNGELYATGRLKDLIIINGKNYYPQDIEITVENSNPFIMPGSVAAFTVDGKASEELVVVAELRDLEAEQIKEKGFLKAKLAKLKSRLLNKDAHKIVTEDVLMSIQQRVFEEHNLLVHHKVLIKHLTIPKTSSNKIQRHACKKHFLEKKLSIIKSHHFTESNERKIDLPETPLQEELCGIFCEVLDLEKIGIHENFFELGGHSLLATQLISRIESNFNIKIPIAKLFDATTVAKVAIVIEESETVAALPSILPVEDKSMLSFAQERLWFIDQLEPGDTSHNIPVAVRISGELDIEALEKSFNYIIDRHETLRTVFQTVDGKPVQIIKEHEYFHLHVTDLTDKNDTDMPWHVPTSDADNIIPLNVLDKAKQMVIAEANTPFDLSEGPLIRAKLIKIEEQNIVLLVNMHHVISDGWSFGVFTSELSQIMNSLLAGETPNLKALPIQYGDFGAWQRQWLEQGEMEKQLGYWKEQLNDSPELLHLPTDYQRPALQSYKGAKEKFTIPEELTGKLNEMSKKEGVTLFMTILSAFNVLLNKLTGEEDICIGSPIANRNRKEIEGLIGFFVNTLVLRTKIDDKQSFTDLLKAVKTTTLGAYANQDVPFEKLVEALSPDRAMSYSPLFQVMMVLQNTPMKKPDLGDVVITAFDIETEIAQFDLTLNLEEKGKTLDAYIEYSTDLFKKDTISRIIKYYLKILKTISENSKITMSDIELIDDEEKHKLLVEWNDTKADYPRDKCIHQLFEEQVEKTPDNIAVIFEDKQLTYSELNSRANKLAHTLRNKGLKPDSIVAIIAEKSIEMIVGILGVLKAGGAYLPIDPDLPDERIKFMLNDSEVKVILTQEYLNDESNYSINNSNPEQINTSSDLAYVIYTSGSTGIPKGVMVEHKAVSNTLIWRKSEYNFNENDTSMVIFSYVFDGFITSFFTPVISGSKVVILNSEEIFNPLAIEKIIERYNVTNFITTPSLLNTIMPEQKSLKIITVAGEALTGAVVSGVKKINPDIEIVNEYGPTENAIVTSYCRNTDKNNISIGRPIANTQVYILDKNDNLCPVGVAGELCISGAGLARGYLNRSELTAEKFVSHRSTSERMYRTGDLAKWLPDGNIEYLGRIDTQVKIRGFRIECGEIENALLKHPEIKESAVVAMGAENNKYLVGYYVSEKELNNDELRAHLSSSLPDYMIPSFFIRLVSVPLTPNGKVDRRALPEPDKTVGSSEYVAPTNEIEEKLVKIWSEILKIEKVGIYDNFFELGGHSLLATQVISRIREIFETEIPVKAIFESPTIAGLEKILSQFSEPIAPEIIPVSRDENLPLSYAQERLWFLDQLEPGITGYNMPGAIRISGELNVNSLEQSLTHIIERHESLRTVFRSEEGKPVQVIKESEYFHIPVTDLTDENDKDTLAKQIADKEAATAFNLSHGPLLRAKLIKLQEKEHILIINMHHIISDGWSIGILIRELGQVLNSLIKGKQPELQPLPVQYADFSVWQKQWMESGELERQLSYWKEQLKDSPDLLHLPIDYTRPPVQTYNGSTINFNIPENLTTKINNISRKHGCTTFMTLLSAFNVLIHKLTGETDISIGSPIANRNRKKIEGLIGFFVNTLVLRTKIEEKQSFVDFLNQVKQTTLLSYDHQDTPFEKLVEAISPERDMSYSPLFQVMMVLQNTPAAAIDLGDVKITPFEIESEIAKFDLTLNLEEADNIMHANIEYNTDLFKPDTISRIIKYYLKVLETITQNNEIKISDIELIDDEEKHKLLVEWNNTKVDYPQDKCVHQLFEEQVEKTPDNIAVIFEDNKMTYRELNNKANQLAHYLKKHGIKKEYIVALMIEPSFDMLISILAILKSGGTYLPIDPEYPENRIEFMLKDSEAKLLLTRKSIEKEFKYAGKRIYLEDKDISGENTLNPGNENTSHNLLYIMYTSGSTGDPKGVMVEHINAVRLIKNTNFINIHESDLILQTGNIVFDATTFEFWGSLLNGAGLCLIKNKDILEPQILGEMIKKHQITILWLTSPLFNQISEENDSIFSGLKYLLVGGDTLSPPHINKVRSKHKGIKVLNGYGPTENTTFSTIHEIEKEYEKKIPLGKPINNSTIYILDKRGNLQPIGVYGELCVGGDGVARGYLNRPELTTEKFVINHYTGERMYKTGDLGRWLPDGNIEFLGRIDTQVKIRGFRIECGEIESTLLKHPEIKKSAVLALGTENNKYLVGYYVSEKELNNDELRAHLSSSLPDYMIPSFFIRLDSIPLTPNGKVDRKALPKPDKTIGSSEYVPPTNETEEKLVKIWSEILKIEKVGINDNFFELGGHSLLATQVISRIRETFKTEIPVRALFESPTIEKLGKLLSESSQTIAPDIIPVSRDESLPLSYAQERLWFLDQLEPDSASYNIHGAIRISGKLSVNILEQSFTHIIERHENLRTVFKTENGKPVQIIREAEYFHIPVTDLSNETDKENKAKQMALSEATTPFNLSKGPLLRAKLINLSENEHILIINMHHIISDGWSIGILIRELGQVMNSLIKGKQKELQPLSVQYADFSVWQKQWMEAGELERQLSYWKEQLQEAPDLLHLPADYTRPPVQTYNGSTINFSIPENLTTKINNISRKHGCTTFMTLLSAFNVILHKLTGENDICVGSPIANRNRKEIEGLIGFFVNTLVLRTKIEEKKSFADLLNQVKQTTLLSYDHQDTPFEKLVEAIYPERDMSYSPLFQVMMVLQNTPDEAINLGDVKIAPFEIESKTSKFDLTLNIEESENILKGNLEYNTDLFKHDTISRLIKYYLKVLETITQNNEIKISDIELIDDEEKYKLLLEWNDTKADYPKDKCIHQLFEEQVSKTPDNIAVVFEDKQLTYRELNEKSNQLAHTLRNKGVKPDSIVAIIAEKSIEMIVGILGVLKASAAYVPIDPEYPENRIAFILKDSEAKLLLTQKYIGENIQYDIEKINLDDEKIYEEKSDNPENINQSRDLMYVMYTSGSTGSPKGVMVEHINAVRLIKNTNFINIHESDRILQTGNIVFDATTFEFWGSLLNGAGLCLIKNKDILEPQILGEMIKKHQITILWLTSPLFNQISEENDSIFSGLKYLLVGGDTLSPPHINKVRSKHKGIKILNGYGPTENTTFSTIHEIDKEYEKKIPLGKPINNSTIYILDKRGNLQPIGVYGELCVGGDGVARGYLNRPELTAEKFVYNPFENTIPLSPPLIKVDGGIEKFNNRNRLYRTGDLGRWLPDGNIEFLGRIDTQVKIRGFRIECGEIESTLLKHPEIKKSAVLPLGAENNKYLVGYYVSEKELNNDELRAHLSSSLPDYMIPSFFIRLDSIPLTPNGKVDRKALPKPDKTIGSSEYVPPTNETEEKLVKIWSEILKIEKVGINDNFFELGGHSLLATQVISRIRETFKTEIPVRALFESPTIEKLGKLLSESSQTIAPEILPVSRDENLALSYAQERLWFLDQLEPDSAGYNIPGAIRISGNLSVNILEQSFTHIIERHENLRTVFKTENGKPVQIIREAEYFHIPVTDLSDENDKETLAKQLAIAESTSPFNLSKGPLLRAKLINLSENEHILIINMHHIISDGWSIGILIRELGQVLNSLIKGKQSELQPLPIQYADFSVWQRQWLEAGELGRQLSYWKEQLQDSPDLLHLPIDYTRPPVQTYNGSTINFNISENLTTKINNISRKHGCTTFMTLLSAFNVLLHKLTGENDICVGSPIANRNRKELEGLIGFFVNTLVLRSKINDKLSFVDLLNQVKQTTLLSYDHQDTPFEKLVEAISPERDMSYSPLFQVMMVLQNTPDEAIDLGDVEIAPFEIESKISKFDLTLNLEESENILNGNLEYNTDLFKNDTISRLIKYYLKVLETITENNEIKISDIELIDDEEKQKLLLEWNDTKADYPKDKCIHQLFEEQVSKTPDNIAVVFEDKQLTYRDLNEKSNQLAHTLRDKRVKPDSIVAIIAEKSIEMIVGILGVLKAGGAYLPIAPDLPDERIKFMLKDADVEHILTQEYLNDESNYSSNYSNPEQLNTSSDLAYVIYTSGSTGIPKGVMIEHNGLVNLAVWQKNSFGLSEKDITASSSSFVFDAFILDTFPYLITGSAIHILNDSVRLDMDKLNEYFDRNKITVSFLTTKLYEQFMNYENKYLHTIFTGGDKLNLSNISNRRVFNFYGPTENTVCTTSFHVNDTYSNIPIGRPIANTQVYILDKNDNLCPVGVAGELCISGAGIARGYLNRPELTAEKFIPNQFTPPLAKGVGGISNRFYRTGDLARWLPDGNIEYLGRIDTQVKIRGFRIECGEIENALLQHENIKESLVTPYKEEGKENILVAYIVLKNTENSIGSSDLREMLKKQLPDYMIPSFFINLDSIPLNSSGKVDRRKLPKPDKTIGRSEYVAPTNETEEKLVKIWSEILKIEKIGIHDNFFELGGHSLLATQVISRVRELFDVEIPLTELFKSPTIENLARFCQDVSENYEEFEI